MAELDVVVADLIVGESLVSFGDFDKAIIKHFGGLIGARADLVGVELQ